MNKRIRIGMGQMLVEGGELQRNFQRAERMIKDAVVESCDIILLPECMDLGWTHPSAKIEAHSIPGSYSDLLCQHARENNIFICAGLTEKEKGSAKIYNSAIFINSSGEIILKYRKINVTKAGEDFYEIGNMLSVVETPWGTMGVNICSDNYMDGLSIGHTLAQMGAQIILSPSSWTVDYLITEENKDPYGDKWIKPYLILAKTHNLVVVGTTSVGTIVGGPYEGKKMIGCSLAVGVEGIIAQGSHNEFAGELVIAEFDVPINLVNKVIKNVELKQFQLI